MLALFGILLRKWKEYRLYSTTKNELGSLSNRDLNDLGINRCDIEFIAREHSKNAQAIKAA
jgi:uncharacterized protein YjiS (DUF1127 family)